MIWLGGAGAIILIVLVWIKRRYKKDFVRQHRKELGWIRPIASGMLWIADWWGKGEPGRREDAYAQAVHVRESAQEQKAMRMAKAFGSAWYCLMAGCILAMCAGIGAEDGTVTPEQGIARPTFGEEDAYTFFVDGLTDQTEEIIVTVEGVQPGEEVMAELFDEIMEKTKTEMLGENVSLDEVRYDLNLPTVSDYGVRLEWESSDSELINDWGEIQEENVREKVEEDGTLISFSVRMTYASYESNYDLYIRLMPPIKDEEYLKNLLISEIKKREEETADDPVFYLPSQVEARNLRYQQKSDAMSWEYILLAAAAAAAWIWSGHNRMREEFEKRNRQIQRDYPQVLAKLGILLRAGMTIRGAWERMVMEYERQVEEHPDKKRYVYEEMFVTWNQIRNGSPEGKAYMEFGRRCGTYAYVKFGNILEQNLKQGIAGISRALEREMTEALEERKNLALRRGEEAQTKLLLPMFLMLGIVLAVLLVPAFLSF